MTFLTRQVDEKVRSSMFRLRQTWSGVFPAKKLYAIDLRVSSIDPAWPVMSSASKNTIHVNPKVFKKVRGHGCVRGLVAHFVDVSIC